MAKERAYLIDKYNCWPAYNYHQYSGGYCLSISVLPLLHNYRYKYICKFLSSVLIFYLLHLFVFDKMAGISKKTCIFLLPHYCDKFQQSL